MNRQTYRVVELFVLIGMCLTGGLFQQAFASRAPAPPLNPTTYRSASGQYALHVNPSDRQGRGKGTYCMSKDGREIWRKELSFTLREARVLDDGTTTGYAYTLGPDAHGGKSRRDYGDLVIVILDPSGGVRLKNAIKRYNAHRTTAEEVPHPVALKFFTDLENDRFVVLTRDLDADRFCTTWRQYQLSTGKQLGESRPKEKLGDTERIYWCHMPRPIPGTPLTLVQWYRSQCNSNLKGTYFAIIDMKGDPVWQKNLPDDYSVPGDKAAEKLLSNWLYGDSAILSVAARGKFDLVFAKEKKRVSFVVKRDEKGQWTVTETGRKAWEVPKIVVDTKTLAEKVAEASFKKIPQGTLDYLGAVKLALDDPPTLECPGVTLGAMDRQGHLLILDNLAYCLHVFSPEGKRLFICKLNPSDANAETAMFPNITIAHTGEILVKLPKDKDKGEGYIRFSPTGKRLDITRLGLDSFTEEWYCLPNIDRRWVKCYKEIHLVDSKDKVLKTIKRRPDGNWLQRLDALAVGPDGSFVVIDEPRCRYSSFSNWSSFNLYSATGKPIRTFPIPTSCFGQLAYNGRLIVASNLFGSLFLYDTSGKALLRCNLDKYLSSDAVYSPFFSPDGKELQILAADTQTLHRFALPKLE